MDAIKLISQDLFDKVRSRFSNLEMGDSMGGVTIDPSEAYYFDFDFIIEGNNLGRVSVSLGELGSLKIYYSQGITENQDDPVKRHWFNFLREMRFFAMRRKLRFDTRDISKNNLDKNDFQQMAATQRPKEEEMNTMNESRWNHKSSSKTSRAVQGKTEVIVRHESAVDETYAGARSQRKNIKAIFIQNADGERLKYPFIHPAGAFAMAQHVDHGGVPHDPAGKAIIDMSAQIAKLSEFHRKINVAEMHPDAHHISERAMAHLAELKNRVGMLSKRNHYQQWISEFQEPQEPVMTELDAVTMEDYKSKFTQTSFQEELAGYFPLLHRIMGEANTVDLEEYVSEQDIEEATALQSLGGNPRFAQNRPMPQHGSAPWEDDGAYYVMHTNVRTSESDPYKGPFASEQEAQAWIDSESPDPETYSVGTPGNIGHIDHGKPVNEPSNFSKPNNPNRTGRNAAQALAQRGMQQASPADSINAFEEWADATEKGQIADDQVKALADAISKLPQGNTGPELAMGDNGGEAADFFASYGLDDMDLQQKLKDAANGDENADPFRVLRSWAEPEGENNFPGLMQRIGIQGDETPAEQPPEADAEQPPEADAEQPPAEGDDEESEKPQQAQGTMFEEIAKIVGGRFNRDNMDLGAFNGKENIALEVKKEIAEQFGEDAGVMAEQLALKFMEKLSMERDHGHDNQVQDDGLSMDRLRELMGNVKAKFEAVHGMEEDGSNFDPMKHITDPQKKKELAPYAKHVDQGDYGARAALNKAGGVPDDRGPRGVTQGEGIGQNKNGPKPEDVPAFIRRSKEPGKQAAQAATDQRNKNADAKVWSSPRLPKESFELESIMRLSNFKK